MTPKPRFRSSTTFLLAASLLIAVSPTGAEDWPQWGGPNGDFTVDSVGLAESWPEDGPKQLWKRPLGAGYSAIVVQDGRLFTMLREGDEEVVVALDAKSGETHWEYRYKRAPYEDMRESYGLGPNATPLIVGDRVVTIGVSGHVKCLDTATGKLLWEHDLTAEYGRRKRVEEWGYSGTPLLHDGKILVQVGGDEHAVVAYDQDGAVVWKSAPGGISYAQPTILELAGRDQFIYFEPEGVVGLDPKSGATLWRSAIEFNNGNHLTPLVICDEHHIFVGSQFDSGGGRLLKITEKDGRFVAERQWFHGSLQTSHWPLIRRGDYIYGSIGGNRVSFFAAFNWKTGEIAWRERGFHKAQALFVDGKILFLDEDGELVLTRVSPEGHEVLASAQVTERISWTLPTLVGTTLYVRDLKNVLALDLAK